MSHLRALLLVFLLLTALHSPALAQQQDEPLDVKLIEDVDARPTFSPDGQRIAFPRGDPLAGTFSLIVVGIDGPGTG